MTLNERTTMLAKKIDQTCDELVKEATSDAEVLAIEQHRTELHQALTQRALAEATEGFK